jgi:hypothetical protein
MTTEQQVQIDIILHHASQWGLEWEVETYAVQTIKNEPDVDPVEAYLNAYSEWIR